jgi:hypothetical protein
MESTQVSTVFKQYYPIKKANYRALVEEICTMCTRAETGNILGNQKALDLIRSQFQNVADKCGKNNPAPLVSDSPTASSVDTMEDVPDNVDIPSEETLLREGPFPSLLQQEGLDHSFTFLHETLPNSMVRSVAGFQFVNEQPVAPESIQHRQDGAVSPSGTGTDPAQAVERLQHFLRTDGRLTVVDSTSQNENPDLEQYTIIPPIPEEGSTDEDFEQYLNCGLPQ